MQRLIQATTLENRNSTLGFQTIETMQTTTKEINEMLDSLDPTYGIQTHA
jgi:hypothetical protein